MKVIDPVTFSSDSKIIYLEFKYWHLTNNDAESAPACLCIINFGNDLEVSNHLLKDCKYCSFSVYLL